MCATIFKVWSTTLDINIINVLLSGYFLLIRVYVCNVVVGHHTSWVEVFEISLHIRENISSMFHCYGHSAEPQEGIYLMSAKFLPPSKHFFLPKLLKNLNESFKAQLISRATDNWLKEWKHISLFKSAGNYLAHYAWSVEKKNSPNQAWYRRWNLIIKGTVSLKQKK